MREELHDALILLPNLPLPDAADEDTVLRTVGEPRSEPAADHLELAGALIDMEAAARLSGARFAYLKGDLVMLELALVRWSLERVRARGFEPASRPFSSASRRSTARASCPTPSSRSIRCPTTSSTSSAPRRSRSRRFTRGRSSTRSELPLRYAGFSPCFRREAGAAGKDTRGIFRVHQFDKVEMFVFTTVEAAEAQHEEILEIEEALLRELEIPYRVVNISVADLGASAAKKYDCEGWLPSQGRYRELTSCSNTTDYQSRRLEIRVRGADGANRDRGTRSTAPRWRSGARSSRCSKTTSARTELSEIPACLVDYGAPAVIAAAAR